MNLDKFGFVKEKNDLLLCYYPTTKQRQLRLLEGKSNIP